MIFNCGDCAVEEGQLHWDGCDQERCSKCGKQVLAWGRCKDAKLEPFFHEGFSCKRCGKFFPDLVMVSDEEWKFICGGTYDKRDILCKKCMDFIKKERGKNGKSNP